LSNYSQTLAKKHAFGVSQTLAFVYWMSRLIATSLKPNGQAVCGVAASSGVACFLKAREE